MKRGWKMSRPLPQVKIIFEQCCSREDVLLCPLRITSVPFIDCYSGALPKQIKLGMRVWKQLKRISVKCDEHFQKAKQKGSSWLGAFKFIYMKFRLRGCFEDGWGEKIYVVDKFEMLRISLYRYIIKIINYHCRPVIKISILYSEKNSKFHPIF